MADLQIGNVHGVAARGGTGNTNINGGDNDGAGYNDADLLSIDAMRSRLAAIDGSYYTTAMLNSMTTNDMVYAIRQNDAAGTL